MDELSKLSDQDMIDIMSKANRGITQVFKIIDTRKIEGVNKLLQDASLKTSCGICGKQPCGVDTSLFLLTLRESGKMMIFIGICKDCEASTLGESDIRTHYRSFLSSQSNMTYRCLIIYDGKVQGYFS